MSSAWLDQTTIQHLISCHSQIKIMFDCKILPSAGHLIHRNVRVTVTFEFSDWDNKLDDKDFSFAVTEKRSSLTCSSKVTSFVWKNMMKTRWFRKFPPTNFGTYSNSTGSNTLLPLPASLSLSLWVLGACECACSYILSTLAQITVRTSYSRHIKTCREKIIINKE